MPRIKLHEKIQNVYKHILKPLFSIEVLGENGSWNPITSVNITHKQNLYRVRTKNTELLCSENHILIDENHQEIKAIDSLGVGILTKNNGIEEVLSVEKTMIVKETYDLSLAENTKHTYYCNNLLSHNCVILDEAAFVPVNIADRLFTSIFPIISSSKDGKIILVSTPNGTGNLFYDIWKKAHSEESELEGWKPFTMWWWQVPGHDEEWKKKTIAAIGKERFAQEFNNEFVAGSTFQKLVPEDVIEKHRIWIANLKKSNPSLASGKELQIFSESQGCVFPFTMWHGFDPSRTYVAAADVAEGLGGSSDSSVLYVFDITDLGHIVQCAKFAMNSVSPVEFAFVTNKILSLYGQPYFICERNGVGSSYLDILKITYEYPHFAIENKSNEIGIRSTYGVKSDSLRWTRQMLTTVGYSWELYDEQLIQELTTFIKDSRNPKASYKAAVGAHDDLVLTLNWICWMMHPDIIEKYFVVAETFKTEFDEILPLKVAPGFDYSQNQINSALNDPLYTQYRSYKTQIEQEFKIKTKDDLDYNKDLMGDYPHPEVKLNNMFRNYSPRSNYRPKNYVVINSDAFDGYFFTDKDFIDIGY